MTGALEAMVVDYQCIMPAVTDVATLLPHPGHLDRGQGQVPGRRRTSRSTRATGSRSARTSSAGRSRPTRTGTRTASASRSSPVPMMAGFCVEAILGALGGTPQPLVDAIVAGTHPRRRRRRRLQQPQDHPGLRARHADAPADRERHPGPRHRLRGGGQRQGRADGARGRRDGRSRTAGRLRVARDPAGPAHGVVRRQHARPRARGSARQAPRRRHQPAAAGRCRAGVVLGEGGGDRRLRRGIGDHHGPRRPAADLRQRTRSWTCSPTVSKGSSARSSRSNPIPRRRRSSSAATWRRSDGPSACRTSRRRRSTRRSLSRSASDMAPTPTPLAVDHDEGIRIVVTGKGGVGKTTHLRRPREAARPRGPAHAGGRRGRAAQPRSRARDAAGRGRTARPALPPSRLHRGEDRGPARATGSAR